VVAATLLGVSTPAATAAPLPPTPADGVVDETFVSSPDLFNTDLGSVRRIAPRARVDSWNQRYAAAVDVVMDSIEGERPDDVLVAGDLVEGHWGIDDARTGIFGRITDPTSRRRALERAARFYYDQWADRFDRRGLTVHAALGDHELGDDGWEKPDAGSRFKLATLALRKRLFAERMVDPHRYPLHPSGPAARTAYAERLAPEVLLVTLDEFERTDRGVRLRPDRRQLAWLDRVLRGARRDGVDWIVVQGHLPVLGPVRARGSSQLFVEGGQRSALWRTLARYDVDLYLAGEVHATTARSAQGVTQITHGGLFAYGLTSYLVGQVDGDRLRLRLKDFRARVGRDGPRLWQTQTSRGGPARITYRRDPPVRGTMTLAADNRILERSGLLGRYRP